MADNTPSTQPPPAGPPNPWPKNVIWLAVIGVVALNAVLVFRSDSNPKQ